MQSCSVLEDKQITKEISDFLASEKTLQSNKPGVSISLSAFEKKLSQKFKCSVEVDRQRIIGMLTMILTARNRYLESSSKGRPVQLFILTTDEPEIEPSQVEVPENIIPDLSPCFSGRVQIQGQDIKTAHWPSGFFIIPNFLTESQYQAFQQNIYNAQFTSEKLGCLSALFSQYKLAPSSPGKTSIHQNAARSSGIKINIDGIILLLAIGETVSFSTSYKGTNITIPLVSGSLLCIDSSISNAQISPPKTGINSIVQFRFSSIK